MLYENQNLGRDYSWEDVIPSSHPARSTLIASIKRKESLIGREMTLSQARSFAQSTVGDIKRGVTNVNPSIVVEYEKQHGPLFEQQAQLPGAAKDGGMARKILPFAAAGVVGLLLFR